LNLISLTSLRFLAALLVFGYHGNVVLGDTSQSVTSVLFGAGSVGVTFFFLLSGFLLAWVHRPDDTPGRFYRRRFARIYPAYIATLLIGFLLVAIASPKNLADGLATPFLLQAWLPNTNNVLAINIPAWSLSVEAFFYLLFPLVIGTISRLTEVWRAAAGAILVLILIAIASPDLALAAREHFGYTLGYFPPARLPEFLLGVLAGVRFGKVGLPHVPIWIPASLSVAVVLWAGWSHSEWGLTVMPVLPFLLLIAAVAASDRDGHVTLLHHPAIVHLGKWSYCFYLVHVLVLGVVHSTFEFFRADGFADGWAVWVVTLAAAVLSSYLLYRFVEKPFQVILSSNRGREPLRTRP